MGFIQTCISICQWLPNNNKSNENYKYYIDREFWLIKSRDDVLLFHCIYIQFIIIKDFETEPIYAPPHHSHYPLSYITKKRS